MEIVERENYFEDFLFTGNVERRTQNVEHIQHIQIIYIMCKKNKGGKMAHFE